MFRFRFEQPSTTGVFQRRMSAEQECDELPLINALRADVDLWRQSGYPNATPITCQPFGTTGDVDFKTVRPCFSTRASHINQVASDTQTWEQSAAFR